MSDRPQPQQVHVYPQGRHEGGVQHYHKSHVFPSDYNLNQTGPSTSQVLALLAGLPVGGTLLALAGLTLLGTFIGLALATPLFIIFSPVLVPAIIVIGLAVAGFLTSGAAGLTGLSSFSWVMNYIRQIHGTVPNQLDYAKQRFADAAGYVGQKTKEVGQDIQSRAHDVKRSST